MATWSIISPASHPLASIDNTGKVTFQKHTQITQYTLQYSNDPDCESASIKNVVVFPCDTDCSYLVTSSGNKVSSAVTSTEYIVGVVTTSPTCNGTWSFTHVSGTDFLTGFRVSGGYVYASVKAANDSSSDRSAKYKATYTPNDSSIIINEPMNFGVTQQGKGSTPPASNCPVIGGVAASVIKPSGSTGSVVLIQLSGVNPDTTTMSASTNVSWVSNLQVIGRASGVYDVMGTYTANPGGSARTFTIFIKNGTETCVSVGFSQQPQT